MSTFVINTKRCNSAGEMRSPLHVFGTFFFTALCGEDAAGPYTYDKVHKWLAKDNVGYNIFRCAVWVIPINLKADNHWAMVTVVLPKDVGEGLPPTSGEIRYTDSNSIKVTQKATKIMVCRNCEM
jgi:Ulp1 family protease